MRIIVFHALQFAVHGSYSLISIVDSIVLFFNQNNLVFSYLLKQYYYIKQSKWFILLQKGNVHSV